MNKRKHKFAEIYGWYGAGAILLAYALLSFKVIHSNSYVYQLLNLTGAVGIVVISIYKKDRQVIALNTVWTIVAAIAIVGLVTH